MPWVRLDENFAQHPKVLQAGPLGLALHVAALCYSNRYLTDGFIPKLVVPTLLHLRQHRRVVAALLATGLWDETEGGYWIHDFHDFQPSKAEVLELQAKRSSAGRRGAAGRWKDKPDGKSHSKPDGKSKAPLMTKECPGPVPGTEREKPSSSSSLGTLMVERGYDEDDVIAALQRLETRNRFGEPIKDPVAWLPKVLTTLATARTKATSKTPARALLDGVPHVYRDGEWIEEGSA